MFWNKNLSDSDSSKIIHVEDAFFIGWQPSGPGEDFPLYNITAPDKKLYGSTVSDQTLPSLNLRIPEIPLFDRKKHVSARKRIITMLYKIMFVTIIMCLLGLITSFTLAG